MPIHRALISGITGQDGAYLASLLLKKGYEIHGTSRQATQETLANLRMLEILNRVHVHEVDVHSFEEVCHVLDHVRPEEVYHLAGESSVGFSFREPAAVLSSICTDTVNFLEAIRRDFPQTRFYNSASSEMFGDTAERPLNELSHIHPKSPYAVGKCAAYWAVVNYRESYGLHACSGILFNHESPLRSTRFVTRKITSAVARIKAGIDKELCLGNLSIQRDWGYAPEYVEAMWLMVQKKTPDDYCIATGKKHSLEEFVAMAFAEVGLDWRQYTVTKPEYIRPNEVQCSFGDSSKARRALKWAARTGLKQLIHLMVQNDLKQTTLSTH